MFTLLVNIVTVGAWNTNT